MLQEEETREQVYGGRRMQSSPKRDFIASLGQSTDDRYPSALSQSVSQTPRQGKTSSTKRQIIYQVSSHFLNCMNYDREFFKHE